MTQKQNPVALLRGASRLAIEATQEITTVVENMHRRIAGGPDILGRPLEAPARLITGLVYGGIRSVTQLVGASIELVLAQLAPLFAERLAEAGPQRDAALAVLDGVLGDYLSETGNALAIQMRLRYRGCALSIEKKALRAALPHASGKLLVMVHGSCLSDWQWKRGDHDHGAALARDLGYTPVYLHYNTGLHISTNGRAFAGLLEELVKQWPVPLDEVVLLTHSMGGLVSRSACHFAEAEGQGWLRKLRHMIFLGTPHQGAPLERGGNWIDLLLGIHRYSAPLGRLSRIRSAGITDLRFGNVLDEHWNGRDRFALTGDPRNELKLPEGVACYAVAATKEPRMRASLPGDGLVPVDSALGRHERSELTLGFPESHQWIGFGMNHVDLLERAEVYATIRRWLS